MKPTDKEQLVIPSLGKDRKKNGRHLLCIKDGFNFSVIAEYIEKYIEFSFEECNNCWGFRLCSLCFIQSRQSGKFSKEKRMPYCRGHKSNLVSNLKLYVEIREGNPEAFKYLEDVQGKNENEYINSMIED